LALAKSSASTNNDGGRDPVDGQVFRTNAARWTLELFGTLRLPLEH